MTTAVSRVEHDGRNPAAIPVSIITGFLGSGKTTLLNRLLQDPALANSLVIINEFGEIGIDHLLVSTPIENMRLLGNGCLCCVVRGDLVDTLADAARQRRDGSIPPFDRVLVETTGLADPVPIIQTVVTDQEVAPSYRLDTVIGVVDAVNAQTQFDHQPESVKQVAVSDLLLLSKTDIASADQIAEVESRVRAINRSVEMIRVLHGGVDPRLLFGRGTVDGHAAAGQVARWLGDPKDGTDDACAFDDHAHCDHGHHDHASTRHDDRVYTFSVTQDQPTNPGALTIWLSMLASFRSANLLRVKGLVNVEGRPVVIHAVQSVLHEPVELAHWPSEDRRSRIVFIVRDMQREELERTMDVLLAPETSSSKNELDPQAYAQFLQMARTFM